MPSNSFRHKCIYKESVELTSVYPVEGCGKTQWKINDTIPHTRIDMGYRDTQNVSDHSYLYEVSVVSSHPLYKKTSTFSTKDLRKTLSQYVMPDGFHRMDFQMSEEFFG